jgi:hypothetical protein
MSIGRWILIVALVVVLSGCSSYKSQESQAILDSPMQIQATVVGDADIAAYTSWDWAPRPANSPQSFEYMTKDLKFMVENAVVTQIDAKGYKKRSKDPELIVSYLVTPANVTMEKMEEIYKGYSAPDQELDLPDPAHGDRMDWEEGSLFVLVFDAKTKVLVWYSVAQAKAYSRISGELRQQRIDKAVKTMLADFPKR